MVLYLPLAQRVSFHGLVSVKWRLQYLQVAMSLRRDNQTLSLIREVLKLDSYSDEIAEERFKVLTEESSDSAASSF
eukprot:gene898-402_t